MMLAAVTLAQAPRCRKPGHRLPRSILPADLAGVLLVALLDLFLSAYPQVGGHAVGLAGVVAALVATLTLVGDN